MYFIAALMYNLLSPFRGIDCYAIWFAFYAYSIMRQFLTFLQQLMTELLSDGASLNTTLNYKYDESHVLHKIPYNNVQMTHFHTRGYSTSTVLVVVRLMLCIIILFV